MSSGLKETYTFATYFDSDLGISGIFSLTESLRQFGGRFADSEVRMYLPQSVTIDDAEFKQRIKEHHVLLKRCRVPESAEKFFYGGKPFAAAAAEADAEKSGHNLVWLDHDAIFLSEPTAFELAPDTCLAYLPVMHNRSGTNFESPPDAFWSRIYELQQLTPEMLFPMITPADEEKIRAYFHCGILAVRPHKGIMRRWAAEFKRLCTDDALIAISEENQTYRIFLHQAALTGAILHTITRDEMLELPEVYNYPIFFDRQYGAKKPYNDITDAVIIRCVVNLKKIGDNWPDELIGPDDKKDWLRNHLAQ
ncbi:MAG: hypothetical protein R3F48_06375 [Candidatus Zixiibacteriota bacterium]